MEFTMNEKSWKPVNVSYRGDAKHATKRWRGELDMNEWIGIIIRRHVAWTDEQWHMYAHDMFIRQPE